VYVCAGHAESVCFQGDALGRWTSGAMSSWLFLVYPVRQGHRRTVEMRRIFHRLSKGKGVPVLAVEAYAGIKRTTPLILNLSTR
jgi:hypothetical protein